MKGRTEAASRACMPPPETRERPGHRSPVTGITGSSSPDHQDVAANHLAGAAGRVEAAPTGREAVTDRNTIAAVSDGLLHQKTKTRKHLMTRTMVASLALALALALTVAG